MQVDGSLIKPIKILIKLRCFRMGNTQWKHPSVNRKIVKTKSKIKLCCRIRGKMKRFSGGKYGGFDKCVDVLFKNHIIPFEIVIPENSRYIFLRIFVFEVLFYCYKLDNLRYCNRQNWYSKQINVFNKTNPNEQQKAVIDSV